VRAEFLFIKRTTTRDIVIATDTNEMIVVAFFAVEV